MWLRKREADTNPRQTLNKQDGRVLQQPSCVRCEHMQFDLCRWRPATGHFSRLCRREEEVNLLKEYKAWLDVVLFGSN